MTSHGLESKYTDIYKYQGINPRGTHIISYLLPFVLSSSLFELDRRSVLGQEAQVTLTSVLWCRIYWRKRKYAQKESNLTKNPTTGKVCPKISSDPIDFSVPGRVGFRNPTQSTHLLPNCSGDDVGEPENSPTIIEGASSLYSSSHSMYKINLSFKSVSRKFNFVLLGPDKQTRNYTGLEKSKTYAPFIWT